MSDLKFKSEVGSIEDAWVMTGQLIGLGVIRCTSLEHFLTVVEKVRESRSGEGPTQNRRLRELVQEGSSIADAAKQVGISYSAAKAVLAV